MDLSSLMIGSRFVLALIAGGLFGVTPALCLAEMERATEHPLAPVLADAAKALQRIEREYPGYSCTFIKRERVDGTLMPPAQLQLKVRHEKVAAGLTVSPFSVYARFEGGRQKGREVIYVDGQNDGRMFVRNGGRHFASLTMSLDPAGPLAMNGSRYPITTVGIENLIQRLVKVGAQETQWDECEVRSTPDLKVNGRKCTLIEIKHPVPRPHFQYYLARIYTDDELELPIGFEAYLWPEREGAPPALLERYAYLNLRFDVPSDHDFDPENEAYSFYRRRPVQPTESSTTDLRSDESVATSQAGPAVVTVPATGILTATTDQQHAVTSSD